jgi:hypothetical protein
MAEMPNSPPRAVVRTASCPRCQSDSMILRAVPGRPGIEHLTLRCIDCSLIHNSQVRGDR